LAHLDLAQLRQSALEIFRAALRSVDAKEVTSSAISVEQNVIRIVDSSLDGKMPVFVVAIGKAAGSMAQALDQTLGHRIAAGVVTFPKNIETYLPTKWQQFRGGHPLPNEDSLAAAEAAFRLLHQADNEKAVIIFAISGGGSAMMEWPVSPDISLQDLQQANRILVTCGATISEINAVRRSFSAVKGGKLASLVRNAHPVTVIISDTNHGDEGNVASGPTLAPPKGSASEIIQRFKLESKLPASILRAIRDSPEPVFDSNHPHYVLADNRTALASAANHATSLGFQPFLVDSISEQQISEGCRELINQLNAQHPPVCLISGGEFSCPVIGDGIGGRNNETVLRWVEEIGGEENVLVLSAGTDGIDGNSPAAGAIADNVSASRARALNLVPAEFLSHSDSYNFFSQLGDAIVTGPTGTNVRDVRLLLKK
jgi:glycerate-2-kinase